MKTNLFFLCWITFFMTFAQQHFVISNVRLFDGETIQENIHVEVKDGYIDSVSKSPISLDIPIIDGSGKTLIPALSNAHVHVWSPQSLNEAAKAGVLNVFDMHGVEMYQDRLRVFKDSTNYANFYAAGAAATVPEGHGTQYGFPTPTLTKVSEAEKFIKDRVEKGADYIKIIVEPWKTTLSHDVVTELIKEAHQLNKIAVVHISQLEDAKKVLNNMADGLVHIWPDEPISEADLNILKNNNPFFIIPTMLTTLRSVDYMQKNNRGEEIYMTCETLLQELKKLYDAHIPLLTGTDPPNLDINYGTDLYEEIKLFVEAGIPNVEALKSATSHISKSFGIEKAGHIKPGFKADMILLNGNPLENINDISKIELIWKNGKLLN